MPNKPALGAEMFDRIILRDSLLQFARGCFAFYPIYLYFSTCSVITPGEVVISGYPIETSVSKVRTYTGIEGETELIENVLVTNEAATQNLANAVKNYLCLRNTYEFEYRGHPEVDSTDIVNLQSKYDKNFKSRVLKHEISFDGTIKGHAIMKKM